METRHTATLLRARSRKSTDLPRDPEPRWPDRSIGAAPELTPAPEGVRLSPPSSPSPAPASTGAPAAAPAALPAGLRRRLIACLGPEAYERFFERKARLSFGEGGIDVLVPSRFMAELLGRRFGALLRDAARAETGAEIPVSFRVEPGPSVGAAENAAADRRGGASPHSPAAAPKTPSAAPTPARARRPSVAPSVSWSRLEDFQVGRANRLAYEAALRIVQNDPADARALSPLFVHGACGMGKTHLLQGIARRFKELHPGAVVRYTTGEAFTNEFIAAVREGRAGGAASRAERFRRAYRNVDLLCIDDVHFLANKQATQAELLHTFDAIDLSGARVVLASDGPPRQIQRCSDALVSRFLSGMVVRIEAPEAELRERIVRTLAARRGLAMDDSGARALAEHADNPSHPPSIRELEGLLTRVEAVWRLLLAQPGARLAPIGRLAVEQALRAGDPAQPGDAPAASRRIQRPVRIEQIIAHVCRELGVEHGEMVGRGRHRRVVLARSLIAHLARRLTTMSFPEVARGMGRPNHSTIVTACQRLKAQMDAGAPCGLEGDFAPLSLSELADRFAAAIMRQTA